MAKLNKIEELSREIEVIFDIAHGTGCDENKKKQLEDLLDEKRWELDKLAKDIYVIFAYTSAVIEFDIELSLSYVLHPEDKQSATIKNCKIG